MNGIPDPKAARALELFEKGLAPFVIAERLGVRTNYVNEMIKRARVRRERQEAELLERSGQGCWQKLGDITARIVDDLKPVTFSVPLQGTLAAALKEEAAKSGNKPETIIAEAVRAYMGDAA